MYTNAQRVSRDASAALQKAKQAEGRPFFLHHKVRAGDRHELSEVGGVEGELHVPCGAKEGLRTYLPNRRSLLSCFLQQCAPQDTHVFACGAHLMQWCSPHAVFFCECCLCQVGLCRCFLWTWCVVKCVACHWVSSSGDGVWEVMC